jgi:hypothetical protein
MLHLGAMRRSLGSACIALAACTGATDSAPATGGAGFQFAPVDLALVDTINPLGHMTTPFNVLPQARIYFVLKDRSQTTPIRAPAGGTVSWLLGPKPDFRIEVQSSATIKWYVDHVIPSPGIALGSVVSAGQQIATHSGASCCVDFGVLNSELALPGYLRRARYSPETLHADAPLKHFAEPLRSTLYSKVNRFGTDRDGRHDLDVAGRLVGNWFLEGTPEAGSLLPENWPKQLAFAYSNTHPAMVLVSNGGSLPLRNLMAVHDGAPDPATISVASGPVTYRLFQKDPPVSEGNRKGATQIGVLRVQMLADDRIQAEIVSGQNATLTSFSAASRLFTR